MISRVDSPSDLFDVYGRFVGDIEIIDDGININHWLIQEGWAFPAYYNSMTSKEITDIDTKTKEAYSGTRGIWKGYSSMLVPFDFSLYLPSKAEDDQPIDYKTDAGGVDFPKLFRRQVTYEVGRKISKIDQQSLKDYVETLMEDVCYEYEDIFAMGDKATRHKFAEYINEDGKIDFYPRDLIFIEKGSSLKDSDGNKIEEWF